MPVFEDAIVENLVKIVLPKLGESIVSATVVQWFKKVGDPVSLDEPLLEVSTDKVNSEIPSPVAGVLEAILVEPGQEVQVGAVLAHLLPQGIGSTQETVTKQREEIQETSSKKECHDLLSPAVLRLMQEHQISMQEADSIPRTGLGGRLTKQDIETYVATKKKGKTACSSCQSKAIGSDLEKVKMSPLRKAIADNMVRSFYEAPHASLATEVDVTSIVKKIQEKKEEFQKKHGVKLTITAFVARAITKALQAFPLLNASLDGDTILMKRFVNLGIAVSVEEGVMVPVIQSCHQLSLPEIAKAIADLALKARNHRLTPQDVQEGTVTMTNFGMTGTMIGIPIIRYPEVAIVGLGAITKKVVAMPDDSIAIRSILWVSLTFDHRVLDGLYGCGFLNELKRLLEKAPEELF